MWKKDEGGGKVSATKGAKAEPVRRKAPASDSGPAATIGQSISIRGDVTGEEDLIIQGKVEGSVDLQEHSLTIGPHGEVTADISGRVVAVEGRVEGDVVAEERAVLKGSAWVKGDVAAPSVIIEDGARFVGSIDMGEGTENGSRKRPKSSHAGSAGAGRRPGTPGDAEAQNGAKGSDGTPESEGKRVHAGG